MSIKVMTVKIFILAGLISFQLFGQSFGRRFSETSTNRSGNQQIMNEDVMNYSMTYVERALDRPVDPKKYIVGPGDIFGIDIISLEKINVQIPVTPSGDLMIPQVGIINIAGQTLESAINNTTVFIKRRLTAADVNVALITIRTFMVPISGAVKKPGLYIITPVTRLDEIIEMAEGFHQLAKEYTIEIRHADLQVSKINYFDFILEGSLKGNPTFLEGDQIYVPFGDLQKEGIVMRGSVSGSGYDIIAKDETLLHFFLRQTSFSRNADLESVTITRNVGEKEKIITVQPKDFPNTVLKAGDAIDILSERGVSVNGFVQAPGSFTYFPGYSALDYVNMAGGNTVEGDADKLLIRHLDGSVSRSKDVDIRRGDVIIVPRTTKSVWFGEISILEIAASIASLTLTYIAATRSIK